MSKQQKERDPRVVAIAQKLVEIQPYGKDFRKTEPSTADYHAALIAVRTLDALAGHEYAVEETRTEDGASVIVGNSWSKYLDVVKSQADGLADLQKHYVTMTGRVWYTYKVVKRPKAQPYTEVENV